MKTLLTIFLSTLLITGCSVSAKETETASYKTIKSVPEQKIEIRTYDPVVLVETPMNDDGRNSAFRRLFGYITGDNVKQSDIAMTAPVVMDGEVADKSQEIPMTTPVFMDEQAQTQAEGQEIPMTTPVFMDEQAQTQAEGQEIPMTAPVIMGEKSDKEAMMSFVLPSKYTMKTAPVPTNDAVTLRELKDYTVAAITFNGLLSDSNVQKNKDILMKWLDENNYKMTGSYRKAGYDAPFTLPWMRRNEVLIPIELK